MQYAQLFISQIDRFDPDILILAQIPPDAQARVHKHLLNKGKKNIFWVQDIYGIAIQRILKKKFSLFGSFIGDYYIRTERSLLRESDAVIIITEDFEPLLIDWQVSKDKIWTIPNWATIDNLPVKPKWNTWSKVHGLDNQFCFLYSGTLGMKHNPDLLLQLALHFQQNEQVKIVVISEGLGADWLKEKKFELGVDNLILLDYQPFEYLSDVLGTADILVAILEPDAGIYSVPSKVLTYLCAERPLLAALPSENLSARIIRQNKAGIVVSPTSPADLLEAADKLLSNQELRCKLAKNARLYAEENFDIQKIGDQFEEIIKSVQE
jgi:glycosyltransferase involved in cell wall biosynthesis